MDEPERTLWRDRRESWKSAWAETTHKFEQNQKFLERSLENLGLLVGNLKRVLGQAPGYDHKGSRVDKHSKGKVLERKY